MSELFKNGKCEIQWTDPPDREIDLEDNGDDLQLIVESGQATMRPGTARKLEDALDEWLHDFDCHIADHEGWDFNKRRRRRGLQILSRYARRMFGAEEDRKNMRLVGGDLIADLLHAIKANGGDVEQVLWRAHEVYQGDEEEVA